MGIDRTKYPGVPEDFPIEEVVGALPGAQLKLLMVEEDGHYYPTGTSPSEVMDALEICEDITLQLTSYCAKEVRKGHAPDAVLMEVYRYLLQKDWCHRSQYRWVCVKIVQTLGWSLPAELQSASAGPAETSGGAV